MHTMSVFDGDTFIEVQDELGREQTYKGPIDPQLLIGKRILNIVYQPVEFSKVGGALRASLEAAVLD